MIEKLPSGYFVVVGQGSPPRHRCHPGTEPAPTSTVEAHQLILPPPFGLLYVWTTSMSGSAATNLLPAWNELENLRSIQNWMKNIYKGLMVTQFVDASRQPWRERCAANKESSHGNKICWCITATIPQALRPWLILHLSVITMVYLVDTSHLSILHLPRGGKMGKNSHPPLHLASSNREHLATHTQRRGRKMGRNSPCASSRLLAPLLVRTHALDPCRGQRLRSCAVHLGTTPARHASPPRCGASSCRTRGLADSIWRAGGEAPCEALAPPSFRGNKGLMESTWKPTS
jgi:hypothetical protein